MLSEEFISFTPCGLAVGKTSDSRMYPMNLNQGLLIINFTDSFLARHRRIVFGIYRGTPYTKEGMFRLESLKALTDALRWSFREDLTVELLGDGYELSIFWGDVFRFL